MATNEAPARHAHSALDNRREPEALGRGARSDRRRKQRSHVQRRQPLGGRDHTGRGRDDFKIDVSSLRRRLFDNGYAELAVTGSHAVALATLPRLHKDPFDRMLVAQATVEGVTLVTGDPAVARYPGPIRLV